MCEKCETALKTLAETHWLSFVKGRTSNAAMELLLKIEGHDYFSRDRLFQELWPEYKRQSDAGGFLPGLVLFGACSRGAVAISDMQLPGAPLIFVNDHFTQMCGYTRQDVLGKSCRFRKGRRPSRRRSPLLYAAWPKGWIAILRSQTTERMALCLSTS